ncbi:MAG: hypothetical protein KVP17_001575 [Porospora cf. gigantea B]|uniref:uncharacterized protein n=2 Tax=Porospora cf. gigantea B TaxID=2853592 RepID=UPI003571CB5C|nr:MAG: hypothetical protein KVP17_001575 [Porospora cf. gigantea B]
MSKPHKCDCKKSEVKLADCLVWPDIVPISDATPEIVRRLNPPAARLIRHEVDRVLWEKMYKCLSLSSWGPLPIEWVRKPLTELQTLFGTGSFGVLLLGAEEAGTTQVLQQAVETSHQDVRFVLVDCFFADDELSVLLEVLTQLDVPFCKPTFDEAMHLLEACLQRQAQCVVIALEHAERFSTVEGEVCSGARRQALIYSLLDLRHKVDLHFGVVLISAFLLLENSLEKRIRSRLSGAGIHCTWALSDLQVLELSKTFLTIPDSSDQLLGSVIDAFNHLIHSSLCATHTDVLKEISSFTSTGPWNFLRFLQACTSQLLRLGKNFAPGVRRLTSTGPLHIDVEVETRCQCHESPEKRRKVSTRKSTRSAPTVCHHCRRETCQEAPVFVASSHAVASHLFPHLTFNEHLLLVVATQAHRRGDDAFTAGSLREQMATLRQSAGMAQYVAPSGAVDTWHRAHQRLVEMGLLEPCAGPEDGACWRFPLWKQYIANLRHYQLPTQLERLVTKYALK